MDNSIDLEVHDLKYSIKEASEILGGVSYRTLRHYEDKLGLEISRDGAGNRIYSEKDIDLFDKILDLKKKGMTLDGIKAVFQDKGILSNEGDNSVIVIDEKALEIKDYLIKEIRTSIGHQVNEELVEMKELLHENQAKMNDLIEENQELRGLIQEFFQHTEQHSTNMEEHLQEFSEKLEKQDEKQPWYKKLFK